MNKIQKLRKILDYGGDDVEITRITNEIYRVGYCSRCGSCCKNIDIVSRVSDHVVDWLKGYGVGVQIKDNIFESPDSRSKYEHSATLSFPITCKHLSTSLSNDGIAIEPTLGNIRESNPEVVIPLPNNADIPAPIIIHTCNIHNNRPAICKLYPRKSSKWPPCTYVFVNDGDMQWLINEWEKKYGKEKKIKFVA